MAQMLTVQFLIDGPETSRCMSFAGNGPLFRFLVYMVRLQFSIWTENLHARSNILALAAG